MENITKFIEKDLRLTINQKKSKVCPAKLATFFGFNIHSQIGKQDADLAGRQNSGLKINLGN